MNLIENYNKLMEAMGITVDPESAQLSLSYDEDVIPVSVSVQRGDNTETLPVVLPTREVLKKDEDGLSIKFHPFSESPFAAQSEVLNRLVMLAGGRVCMSVQGLVAAVIEASLSYEKHGDYSNSLMRLIKDMPSVKKDKPRLAIQKYADRVMQAHNGIRGPHTVLRFNLRRNQTVGEETFIRYTQLSTPVLDSDEDEMRIFGVKAPSKVAFQTVLRAYQAVLGESYFGCGTNSRTAPYFQSFMGSFLAVCEHLNKVAKKMGRHARKEFRIDTSWSELYTEAETLSKELSIQFEGNVGSTNNDAKESRNAEGASAPKASSINIELNRPAATPAKKPAVSVAPVAVVEEVVEEPVMSTEKKIEFPVSPFRKQANPMMQAAQTQTVAKPQPTKVNQPAGHFNKSNVQAPEVKKSSAVVVNPASQQQSQPSPSRITVQPRVRQIHLHDSLNQPLYLANGQEWMVNENEAPQELFVVVTTPAGHPVFDGKTPRLESITQQEVNELMYGHQQPINPAAQRVQGYGQPQQPAGFQNHPARQALANGGYNQPPQQGYQQPLNSNGMAAHPLQRQQPQQPQPVYGQQPQRYNQQPPQQSGGYLHG